MITPHPTWTTLDSSKLDDYLSCPRKFFFLHILGWRMDLPAHDLWFGTCWHKAREWQLIHGYEDVKGAYEAFLEEYRKEFSADTDNLYNPKTPAAVLHALMMFSEQRHSDLEDNEVVMLDGNLMTEISGTVPIDEHRVLHYRMDSIMRRLNDGKIFSWDHKTTSGKYINKRQWADQFHLSVQNGTYTHCLYCLFPIEQVLGVEFCGVGFEYLSRGSSIRSAGYHIIFQRVPAFKTPEQMNVWLWNVNDLVDDVERDMDRLTHCSDGDVVMQAFQQRPNSCTSYKGCPFLDYCISWQNPLQQCDVPPLGFRIEFWDPSQMKTTNRKDLTWQGR